MATTAVVTLLRMVDAEIGAHTLVADSTLGQLLHSRPLATSALLEGSATNAVEHAGFGAGAGQGRASISAAWGSWRRRGRRRRGRRGDLRLGSGSFIFGGRGLGRRLGN